MSDVSDLPDQFFDPFANRVNEAPAVPADPFVDPPAEERLPQAIEGLPDRVAVQHLGAIAMELVIRGGADQAFLNQYNLRAADIPELLSMPAMQAALAEAKAHLENNVADGFQLRNRALAEAMLGDMYTLGRNPKTEPALRFKIFESASRLARLDPSTEKGGKNAGGGVNVTFNFGPGIRGVSDVPFTIDTDE